MIINTEIEALKLYKKDLEKIIAREELKVQKEKDKQEDKLKAIYEEYENEDVVMEVYGYGGITESKKDKLLELFRNKDKVNNENSADGAYLNILKRDLKSINIELKYPDAPTENNCNDSESNKRIEELELENKKLKEKAKENNLALNHQVDQFVDRNLKLIAENKQLELSLREFQKLKDEKKINERGAGRKSKFTDEEKATIKMYRLQGKTIKEISEIYNCSVGLIHKLINE